MKPWLAGLLLLVLSGSVLAAGPAAVRKRVQASMLVTGHIEVAPDGSVLNYTLDQPDKLPSAARQLVSKAVPAWRFKPVEVDGQPVTAKALMSLRLVASPLANGDYRLSVAGAWFGDGAPRQSNASPQTITYKSRVKPDYPLEAVQARVSGVVYVLLKVGHDGQVTDTDAEQVDLRVIASDGQLKAWRHVLASAALSALKHDTFNVPTTGPEADKPFWIARVPVTFAMDGEAQAGYGQWQAYVPGPIHEPAWGAEHKLAGSPDAMPAGGIMLANHALRLLTSLGGT